ncbi:MAG: cupin domain-containing protein [Sphingosinicella sp.]|nr:cupin domain-containing protein [Sphingosinicella sp.]
MRAVFKADEEETGSTYSTSEWWLEPQSEGPPAHSHAANDDIFYVIEGNARVLVGEIWADAPKGSFVRVPAGVTHSFKNESDAPMGLLNIYIPGGFERDMAGIVEYFSTQVPSD